ncbi:MAG: 23S rRNA (adenine(2503)-C(2))-methyltransferase RlmN [Epsilonproteobacteria bacterium]|nr:23S rRNA (adenine(2503)-C(2))-methyltransferase RlmN [Campylobacterota bacterium]
MKCIMDYLIDELDITPNFRKKQIFDWIYKKYVDDFEEMTNLPKELKAKLSKEFIINPLKIIRHEIASDQTEKFLFELSDKRTIETVLIKMKEDKYTVCVSSQVGCKVGCSFCLTAKDGFVRNLSVAEIVAQVLMMKKVKNFAQNKSLNVVYMGMGEPLDNYDNVVKAIRIIQDEDGLNISPRRQTLSTSGIAPKITKLAKEDLGINLAISLHAVDDKLREELIPMNKAYNIQSVIDAVRQFPINKRKKVLFEYLVIDGVNDDKKSADKLVKLLNGIAAKVNLIYFNPYPGTTYKRPTTQKMEEFKNYLNKKGVICTIRQSKGMDISAACGQLRQKDKDGL